MVVTTAVEFLIMFVRTIRDKVKPVFDAVKTDDVREALNNIVGRAIAPLTLGVAIFYLIFGFVNVFARENEAWSQIAFVHLAAAIFLLGFWGYARNQVISAKWSHLLAGLIAFVVLSVSLIEKARPGQSGAAITVLLLIIGMGCFLTSFRWWAGLTVVAALIWAFVASRAPSSEATVYSDYQLIAAILISFVVLMTRIKALVQLHRLRLHAERHEREMEKGIRIIGHHQERFEKLSEISFEGVAVCENEVIRGANHALALMIGKPLPRLIGGSLSEFIAPRSLAAIQEYLKDGGNHWLEARGRRIDGSEFPMVFQSRPLRTDDQDARLVVIRDVTLEKRTEQALHTARERANSAQARAALARRELEIFKRKHQESLAGSEQIQRELESTRLELRDVRERVQELEEKVRVVRHAKNRLVAALCQEVRAPLTGILGMADLLLESASSADQRELVQMVKGSSRSLLATVSEFHDFSRIETNALSLAAHEFSLPELIEDTVESLGRAAFEKGLSIEALVKNGLPVEVVGDPERVRQILANLVSNAIQFTDEGEVFVQASLTGETESTAEVLIEVQDTGRGISPEAKPRLFQSFAREAETSTAGTSGGLGLGLALSSKLVELMEGTIGVESRAGRGSRFWFKIPFRKPSIYKALSPPECWDARPKRLYLVNLNELSARLVRYYARMLPLRLEERGSPREVWKSLSETAGTESEGVLSIVLLDSSVPDLEVAALSKLLEDNNLVHAVQLIRLAEPYSHFRDPQTEFPGRIQTLPRPIKRSRLLQMMDPGALRAAASAETGKAAGSERERVVAGLSHDQIAKPLSILVVEDQEVNRVVLLKHLEALGLCADTAVNGPAALKHVQKKHYDLILLDCRTPGLDGLGTARQIRDLEQRRERNSGHLLRPIRIVALTAGASDGDVNAYIGAGMDDCLSKPLSKDNLKAVIAKTFQTMISDSEPSGANPVLNPKVLESIRDLAPGDNETFCEVVDLYLKNAADHLSELNDCCERGDLKQAQRLLHSFKGGSRNIGADRLASLLEACESQFEGFTVDSLKKHVEEFREEFSRIQEILTEEKEK